MNLFGDLKSPALMYLKAFLFFVAGTIASVVLLVENPGFRNAFLLGVAVCSFARLYYFMFYVIEKYIDAEYRFAGIGSFVMYLIRRRKRPTAE
jgi:hypothetical protein